jgi:fumarylacetoacetate (FAA) hydrolase family protein
MVANGLIVPCAATRLPAEGSKHQINEALMISDPASLLPRDHADATLVGRVWLPDAQGPAIVILRGNELIDVTASYPTMRDLCEADDPASEVATAKGHSLGGVSSVISNALIDSRDPKRPWLLAPIDLQVVKAAGVTFPVSMLERVIEEQARGDSGKAAGLRAQVQELVGSDLSKIKPGSDAAAKLKEMLVSRGAWSQYLEVGIGPDAEIFTKAPVLSAVGAGADIGLHPISKWNNPEPEVVLVVNSNGHIVGVTLGNDVNLRDVEGRSALLLGKAKDNNASAAIGPFIRFFDQRFSLDDVRKLEIGLEVRGTDGFVLKGKSNMDRISRDPTELVSAMMGAHHQYPDGAVLYCGTMFAPTGDRDATGKGFTHKLGDIVTISNERLGALVNRVKHSTECPPWNFGIADLMRNLAKRQLLKA